MKYSIKIKDIVIDSTNIMDMKLSLIKEKNDGFVNSKGKIQVELNSRLYTDDINEAIKKDLFKNLVLIKDEYFDIEIFYENIIYKVEKMYIHNIEKIFNNGEVHFNIIFYQKYILGDKEIKIIEN